MIFTYDDTLENKIKSACNHDGSKHLEILSDFFGGSYYAPLFSLACKNSAFFIDIQSHLERTE